MALLGVSAARSSTRILSAASRHEKLTSSARSLAARFPDIPRPISNSRGIGIHLKCTPASSSRTSIPLRTSWNNQTTFQQIRLGSSATDKMSPPVLTANMDEFEDRVQRTNEEYHKTFNYAHLTAKPVKKLTVVTCMDSRLDLFAALGLDIGDAHIIRNAGGDVRDALRSLIISQQFLDTEAIMLIKHTQCGMQTFTPTDGQETIYQRLGSAAANKAWELLGRKWGCIEQSLEDQCREDVKDLCSEILLKKGTRVSGWIFHVETGEVLKVDGADGVVGEKR